jgi:hypothetical protein
VVPEIVQLRLARGIATGIRRPHVRWVEPKDVSDSHFIVDHLVLTLCVRDGAEVLVAPCVRCDLMAGSMHAFNHIWPWFSRVIDFSLAEVVSSDKKGPCCFVLVEQIENMTSVKIWSVVEGQSNCAGYRAGIDTGPAISDLRRSGLGTSVSSCGRTWRNFVRITPRSVVDLAVGCSTVLDCISTPSC